VNAGGDPPDSNPTVTVNPQIAITGTNTVVTFTFTGSDTYGEKLTLSIVPGNGPANGICAISQTGPNAAMVTYTPSNNFEGADSFSVSAKNIDGYSSHSPAQATVLVVAGPTNLTAQCPANGVGTLLNWILDGIVQDMEAHYGITIDGFNIYRRSAPGLFTANEFIYSTSDFTQTYYVDQGARIGVTYYYVVTFTCHDNYYTNIYESAYSNASFTEFNGWIRRKTSSRAAFEPQARALLRSNRSGQSLEHSILPILRKMPRF
jgi:hypothetical protein